MAISSKSTRIFDAQDAIMTTDLDLMSKVNFFNQDKFDMGRQAVQNEVDNWQMFAQIAKPELKAYANEKLANLVNGINNLPGSNLADLNNVNALKSLGYNIYGDQAIVDGVTTTRNMRTLQADITKKLSGKDAKNFDPTVGQYLLKGYNEWANDGNPNNTKYDGAVDLPMGNMNTVNAKVTDYLKQLKPDAETIPQGVSPESLGYFNFEGKWLSKERVQEAIEANTDANDQLIFKAHGWRTLGGDTDQGVISKLTTVYDANDAEIKQNINQLQAELNQTQDGGKKLQIQDQIKRQQKALEKNAEERNTWAVKKKLNQEERESIQESLYRNAWKSNVTNSYSYRQQSTTPKLNPITSFKMKEDGIAQRWAADYQLRSKALELKARELGLTGMGGSGQAIVQETEKDPGENVTKDSTPLMDKAKDNYFISSAAYSAALYNIVGATDTKQRFNNVNGEWIPKPEFKGQIDTEVGLLKTKLDNISNLTEDERKAINLPTDPAELNQLLSLKRTANMWGAFNEMALTQENEIFDYAIRTGQIKDDFRNGKVRIASDFSDPSLAGKEITVNDLLSYRRRFGKEFDKVPITPVNLSSHLEGSQGWQKLAEAARKAGKKDISGFTVGDLMQDVNNAKDDMQKAYEKVGGKRFNSYSITLPFDGLAKATKETIQKQLLTKIPGADVDQITPIKGEVDLAKDGTPSYKLTVQSGSGKKLKTEEIDVTDIVKTGNRAGLALYFPTDDRSLVYSLYMDKNGSTPFSETGPNENSLRTTLGNYPYGVSRVSNGIGTYGGTPGLKVKILLPVGGGRTVSVDVKNLGDQNKSTIFPTSINAIQDYIDGWFTTKETTQAFYKAHGLELP